MHKISLSLWIVVATVLVHPLFAQDPSNARLQQVAHDGMYAYLDKIPVAQIREYGFNSSAEFSKITTGTPIRMKKIDPAFNSEHQIIPGRDYIINNNEWRVPLVVNGEYRAFISVIKDKSGALRCVDFGASDLAREIGKISTDNKLQHLSILRLHSLNCDMLMLDKGLNNKSAKPGFIALSSARNTNLFPSNVSKTAQLQPLEKAALLSIIRDAQTARKQNTQ
jgi:hypothetical protein